MDGAAGPCACPHPPPCSPPPHVPRVHVRAPPPAAQLLQVRSARASRRERAGGARGGDVGEGTSETGGAVGLDLLHGEAVDASLDAVEFGRGVLRAHTQVLALERPLLRVPPQRRRVPARGRRHASPNLPLASLLKNGSQASPFALSSLPPRHSVLHARLTENFRLVSEKMAKRDCRQSLLLLLVVALLPLASSYCNLKTYHVPLPPAPAPRAAANPPTFPLRRGVHAWKCPARSVPRRCQRSR